MKKIASLVAVATLSMASASAFAWTNCPLSHDDAQTALNTATAGGGGGFGLPMWITVVNRDGAVCAVAKSAGGVSGGDPWPGSRVIAAQKANTANLFSNSVNAFSTANLYSAVQPGGALFGLQHSNPVDTAVGYRGNPADYGTASDPMNGLKVGGVNVFGGGLAIYDGTGNVIGAIGVSGDTACHDHNIAWQARIALQGVGSPAVENGAAGLQTLVLGSDAMIHDIAGGVSTSGYGHPTCDAPQNPGGEEAFGDGLTPKSVLTAPAAPLFPLAGPA